ncbi:hypothetical protein JTE90_018297 [Oedothorax gibbosus]|uniref:THAP-type domain-containing protein n=1 Tax=Oedothorax gibbosus TaxID=931172 RepID=A0AAV6UEB3_9ARAC|nr:hypothetical protein JTE90_018297 [Oedothorax gibbosus]
MKDGMKVSFFTVPTDKELLNKWIINIRRADKTLDKKCRVCSKHFEEKYILRDYKYVINGEEIRLPKRHATLSKDAIPTIFPNYPKSETFKRKKSLKRASEPLVFKKKENKLTYSKNQGLSISSSVKNEARTSLKPVGNSTIYSAADTEEWTDEETPPEIYGSTVPGQLEEINIPSNTATSLSNANMKQLVCNESHTRVDSSILHQTLANKNLPKTPAVKTFFYPNKEKKFKGTQTKLTSSDILNQKLELKQLRTALMTKLRDNDSLRKKLQEKSEELEFYESNALQRNVAKMQALYNEGLASKQIEFTLSQISNFERKNPRWSDSVLRECVFLHATSPKGYEALRNSELLKLPGRRSLYRFLKPTAANNNDEFCDAIFELPTATDQDELSDKNFDPTTIRNQDELSD